MQLDDTTRRILAAYAWPGNVRELENFMERLSILVDGDIVCTDDLPHKILDHVGDISLLPPVEEVTPEGEAQPQAAQEVPEQNAAAAPAITPVAEGVVVAVAAPSGVFVWPNLGVLAEHGLNLKDFLDTVEGRLIDEALAKAEGVKNQAAELLGIKRTTLIEKLKKRSM